MSSCSPNRCTKDSVTTFCARWSKATLHWRSNGSRTVCRCSPRRAARNRPRPTSRASPSVRWPSSRPCWTLRRCVPSMRPTTLAGRRTWPAVSITRRKWSSRVSVHEISDEFENQFERKRHKHIVLKCFRKDFWEIFSKMFIRTISTFEQLQSSESKDFSSFRSLRTAKTARSLLNKFSNNFATHFVGHITTHAARAKNNHFVHFVLLMIICHFKPGNTQKQICKCLSSLVWLIDFR